MVSLTSSPTVDPNKNNLFFFIKLIGNFSLPVRDVIQ